VAFPGEATAVGHPARRGVLYRAVIGVDRTVSKIDRSANHCPTLPRPRTRLRLLSLVAADAGGRACMCDLTEPVALSQPPVSHHMKVLVDAGLLTRERRGKWAYYRLVLGAMDSLARVLSLAVQAGV
jgi:ArsR family transcriptional regulator